MVIPIFNIGDIITSIQPNNGYENALVTDIKNNSYHLKIVNGIAIIPIQAQINYKLKK